MEDWQQVVGLQYTLYRVSWSFWWQVALQLTLFCCSYSTGFFFFSSCGSLYIGIFTHVCTVVKLPYGMLHSNLYTGALCGTWRCLFWLEAGVALSWETNSCFGFQSSLIETYLQIYLIIGLADMKEKLISVSVSIAQCELVTLRSILWIRSDLLYPLEIYGKVGLLYGMD